MMFLNYLRLFKQFLILCYIKTDKFGQAALIIHYRYYEFFYSGVFLHLLIKLFLHLLLNIQLYGMFNIILLLLSIYISIMIDMNYYIFYILSKLFEYLLRYFDWGSIKCYWQDTPEAEYIRKYHPYYYNPKEPLYQLNLQVKKGQHPRDRTCIKLSENLNLERDRYYLLFKPIFFFLFFIRYFILREPLLFLVLHLFVFINYLQDFNLTLLYIYILILHISRYVFFICPEFQFRIKEWKIAFYELTTRMALYKDEFKMYRINELNELNPELRYDPKVIQKFTINNINLIMYFSLRYELNSARRKKYKEKLSMLEYSINAYEFTRYSWYTSLCGTVDITFYRLCFYIPQIFKDCHKFVKINQWFWFALFLLFIYVENIITQIIINISKPVNTIIINNSIGENNISNLFTFQLSEISINVKIMCITFLNEVIQSIL